ncbi:glycosyltransferase family 1 protein [Synechococcus sp. NB0720_010]|uniref:glycosyltransferase family 4 protein n=1 Tax=Synechococcus sp. NB0720_010 TaxID=2907159 RepID=UPI001FFA467E|nr:glycosyltransferase family 1 protein [Synechococcus sp. NB0720_010]UPH89180.1 glycosyltransferase family 4 protein [Synechococcus sp. NB0720_010]
MTLLLNYRPVLRQPTGIGVYANAVLPALQELPHVLIPGGEEGTAQQRLKRLTWSQYQLPRLAKRYDASVIFTPAPEGYLGPQTIPQVVMVHDLRPISHPERSFQSLYFRSWVPPLLRSCRHVLTNSQFTAREIQRCTGLPDSRITVTPLGYDEDVFKPGPPPRDSHEQPYLLHVGQQYPHKNLRRLIQAFAQLVLRHPELRLVLAGKPHPTETPELKAIVRELGLQERVEFCSYVPYSALPDLYRGAFVLVYPSLWEGFGLPIVEAMACGTPVITSKGSGTEEVAGDAAILVDPTNLMALVASLQGLFDQSHQRSLLRQRGLERAREFGWPQVLATTRSVVSRQLG